MSGEDAFVDQLQEHPMGGIPGPPDPPITPGFGGWPSRERLNSLVATLGIFEWCEANGLLDAEMGELRRARDAFMFDWGPTAERWREQQGNEPESSWSQMAALLKENQELRAASEQTGTRTEYIVVHGEQAVPLTIPLKVDLAEAERVRDAYNPVGFNEVFSDIRLQQRTVTETPWGDIEAEEASC